MLADLLEHPTGRIVVSVILGLGLASMLRRVCRGQSCFVIRGPPHADLKKYVYELDGQCYRYSAVSTQCKK
jgi:hypothetical protein